jgi:hypothetical protein
MLGWDWNRKVKADALSHKRSPAMLHVLFAVRMDSLVIYEKTG